MSNENRTLADWPIRLKGKTVDGESYEIVWHSNEKEVLVVLLRDDGSTYSQFKLVTDESLIHPDDAKVSILDDLSNPEGIPVCKLDIESRKALDKVGWSGLDIKFPNSDEWEPSTNSAQDAPLSSKAGMSSIAYRVRPQPKFRLMTSEEAKKWARSQPKSVIVSTVDQLFLYPVKNLSYDAPIEEYRWVDVNKGGGWKPLPMVEE